ncbi:hypothetical protein L4C36_23155, partial [Photobacterium japonica]|uniref:hypothetical protein n=1 Tax=Photobacterium japonica TaxID=2910235 RepID=UPI003D129C10
MALDINKRIEDLKNKEILLQWQFIGFEGGRYGSLIRWVVILPAACFLPVVLLIASDFSLGIVGMLICAIHLLVSLFVGRYLLLPDYSFNYYVTRTGIRYEQREVIPDIAYKIVRIISWVGIPLCIFSVLIYGPMIFVGAGGFALMSFLFANFKVEKNDYAVFISHPTLVFNPINDTRFSIKSMSEHSINYSCDLHTQSISQKNQIIEDILKLSIGYIVNNVKSMDDKYNHPIYA